MLVPLATGRSYTHLVFDGKKELRLHPRSGFGEMYSVHPAPRPRWCSIKGRSLALASTAVLLATAGMRTAQAGAWNRVAGDGLVITDYTFGRGGRYFDDKGRLAPARSYAKSELASYIEYGATDWLMLIARPSLDATRIGAPDAGHYVGLGGSAVGAQVHLYDYGQAVFAVQSTFRLPGTHSDRNPAEIGDTAREGDFRALGGVGFQLGPFLSFIDAQGSYRLRSGGAAAQWHGDLTFGIYPLSRLLVLLESFTAVPTGPGTTRLPSSRYSKMELKAVYQLNAAWAVQLGASTTVYGRNALLERGFTTGLWYRF